MNDRTVELVRHLRECDGAIALCRRAADEIERQSRLLAEVKSVIGRESSADKQLTESEILRKVYRRIVEETT